MINMRAPMSRDIALSLGVFERTPHAFANSGQSHQARERLAKVRKNPVESIFEEVVALIDTHHFVPSHGKAVSLDEA